MPTFKQAILDRCHTSLEGIGFLSQLKSALLAREGHGLDLALAAPQIEAALRERIALVRRLSSGDDATAVSIVTSLSKELGKPNAGRSRGLGNADEGQPDEGQPLGEAIRQALQEESFSALIRAIATQDLSSVLGKRNALAAGFNGECILAVRVLCSFSKMGDPVRNQDSTRTLARLNDLRPDRCEYFNYVLRVELNQPVVPERMMRYTFATLQSPTLLEQFLQFEFDKMDWIAAPHGLNGYLQALYSRAQPAVTDPRDYFSRVEQLNDLGEFGQRLFTALGCTIGDLDDGFDFKGLCAFYAKHLQCSWKCANQEDQIVWMEESAASFKSSLSLLGATLRQKIYSADPASIVLTRMLIPSASEEIQACLRKQKTLEEFANWRVNYQSMCPPRGTPLGSDALPLLSRKKTSSTDKWGSDKPVGNKGREPGTKDSRPTKSSGESKPKTDDDPQSVEPGSRSGMHTWGANRSTLFISGQVWNIKGIAERHKLDAKSYCWPYLLANCRPAFRVARCDKWGQPGHTTANDSAHRLPKGLNFHTLREFMRPATQAEKESTMGIKTESLKRKRGTRSGAKKAKVTGGSSKISTTDTAVATASDTDGEAPEIGKPEGSNLTSAGQSNGQPAAS